MAAHAQYQRTQCLWNISLIMTKEAHPMFRLHRESRTGSLIIMSPLHSAQGEPSISCHRVWAHGVIVSKVPPIVGTDLFITSLCESTPTQCCTYSVCNASQQFCYYLWGYRPGINDRQRDRNPGEEHGLSSKQSGTHTHPLTHTHARSHRQRWDFTRTQ